MLLLLFLTSQVPNPGVRLRVNMLTYQHALRRRRARDIVWRTPGPRARLTRCTLFVHPLPRLTPFTSFSLVSINSLATRYVKSNVLVMSWIGTPLSAAGGAPQLRDAALSARRLRSAWLQTLTALRQLYLDAKLVHADLSEYNLLWWEKSVYVIDVGQVRYARAVRGAHLIRALFFEATTRTVGKYLVNPADRLRSDHSFLSSFLLFPPQAVEVTHPKANEFLRRDCSVVRAFFERNGLASALLVSVEEMVRITTTKQMRGDDDAVQHVEFVTLALQGRI